MLLLGCLPGRINGDGELGEKGCNSSQNGTEKAYFKKKKVVSRPNRKRCLELSGHKCQHCGSKEEVHPHHIVFQSQGGDDRLENLISLCFKCHRKAHDGYKKNGKWISPKEFIMVEVLPHQDKERYKEILDAE